MAQATHAAFDAGGDAAADGHLPDRASAANTSASDSNIKLVIHEDLAAIERDWRAFEQHADATAFQSFDWLSTWLCHVGLRTGAKPAVVVGRDAHGAMLFLLPLTIERRHGTRRLMWLGSALCDYNAPLLASEFARHIGPEGFVALWQEITQRLQTHPRLGFDVIDLQKMPEKVGEQANPFMRLAVSAHPSGAYLTALGDDWDKFYAAKRSSSTRRRDRTKRNRLGDLGEVEFVNPEQSDDIARTLKTLMTQKSGQFARMGVTDIFALPGWREFFLDVATNPQTRHLVHVSRLDVGAIPAAINLGLTFHGCYYHVLASYDAGDISRFGPGAAHLHDLLRMAIEKGYRVFDFTIGDERYKRDWCDTELTLYDHVAAATWRGAIAVVPLAAVLRLKRRIKQSPALWRLASRARELIGSLRKPS
jgi:CelD/BcsL family acetyltransferase involved in cellulose biosynthesis